MKKGKKILITVGTAFVAKNILKSDVLATLLNEQEIKIVVVLPSGVESQFNHLTLERTIIEGVEAAKSGFLRKIFLWFAYNLVFTSTTAILYGGTIAGEPKKTSLFFKKLIAGTLGKFGFLKNGMEKFDLFFFRARPYKNIFEKYNPDLVFITNLLNDSFDCEILKEAKRKKIFSVGMPKSWDSFNKRFVHLKTDVLLVWNGIVKEEAVLLQNYKPEKVLAVGMPQNDDYAIKRGLIGRNEFLESLGFAESRPLILFGSGGEYTPQDDKILEILVDSIKKGEIKANVLVRPYCGTPNAQRYGILENLPFVKIYSCPEQRVSGGKKWFFHDNQYLINSFAHADVLVTFASTLAVDASFFDLPTVLVGFDFEPRPFLKALRRYYETKHYKNIIETGGVKLAFSKEEFVKYVNDYLQNRSLDSEKRMILRNRIGGPSDGKVGERIGKTIFGFLSD